MYKTKQIKKMIKKKGFNSEEIKKMIPKNKKLSKTIIDKLVKHSASQSSSHIKKMIKFLLDGNTFSKSHEMSLK